MRLPLAALLLAIAVPVLAEPAALPEGRPPVAMPSRPVPVQPLAIGAALPDVGMKLLDFDGGAPALSSYKGEKGLLIVFTCNHCPYAQAWEGRILAVATAAKEKGIGVVLINPNDPKIQPADDQPQMKARAAEKKYMVPYLVDQGAIAARAFKASRTPECFLFGADGKLAYHGAVDDDAEDAATVEHHYLRNAVDALLAGKAIDPNSTKAVGCGIKFPK